MLEGNVFAVIVANSDYFGKIAIAKKIPRHINLVSIIEAYNAETFNVCETWKHAKKLEECWNNSFVANGSQKTIEDFLAKFAIAQKEGDMI